MRVIRSAALPALVLLSATQCWAQLPESAALNYRLVTAKNEKVLQQELDRASDEGYAVALGWPAYDLVILRHRAAEEARTSYLVLGDQKAIEAALARGDCAVRDTLDMRGGRLALIASKPSGAPCESVLLHANRTGTLEKEIQDAVAKGYRVVGLGSDDSGHAAVLQRAVGQSNATAALVAASAQDTLQKELSERAAAGYRIAQSSSWKETVLSLEQREEVPKVDYKVISATKSSTLEQEVNAAAAQGYRYTPGTLHGVQKGAIPMLGRVGTEYVAVLEKGEAAPAGGYVIVGARRWSTLAREFDDAVAKGFAPVALALGFSDQETLVLFEHPRE